MDSYEKVEILSRIKETSEIANGRLKNVFYYDIFWHSHKKRSIFFSAVLSTMQRIADEIPLSLLQHYFCNLNLSKLPASLWKP